MGPEALAQVLRPLTAFSHPMLLVGLKTGDDAAVYRIDDQRALVQTVDFFPPVVDDPYTFGAIAAANAMSDVYAMGGEPFLALNLAAFPDNLPPAILTAVFQGGADKVAEAGAIIAGGHTITDREPKYGLCVTGFVHPDRITTKGGVLPGDLLFLTKPLGSGVITTAIKEQKAKPGDADAAIVAMLLLNRDAARAAARASVAAVTDVSGFGLLGHAWEMAAASGVLLRFRAGRLPLLPGARDYAHQGLWPGGMWRNRQYVFGGDEARSGERAAAAADVDEDLLRLMCDPQTSGGLLVAVNAERAGIFLAECKALGQPVWEIGKAEEGRGIRVVA
jgi:selenide,water dikinase